MTSSKYLEHRGLEWAIKLNRFSLRVLGLWPKAEQTWREKLMCNVQVVVIILLMTMCLIFPWLHSLIRLPEDITLKLEHLQFLLPFVSCIARLMIFWWKKGDVISLINMITQDWLKIKNEHERSMMIKWARRARIIISIAYLMLGITYACIIFAPFFGITLMYVINVTDAEKRLPFPGYYMYDVTKNLQYELTYITQATMGFLGMMSYTGIDNFFGFLVFHICGQLDILKSRLICVDELMKFHESLSSCVIHHIRLLRAIAVVEDTYNIILLVLFLYFGISFAFFGFMIISIVQETDHISIIRIIYFVSVIFNLFIHMGLYCAVGEILITQCDRVYYAVCNHRWYTIDPRKAKDSILFMIGSETAPYLTAGKIFPLKMSTFTNLIKTSAGYISVLLTVRN